MTRTDKAENAVLRDLGDSLVLRRATPGDARALAEFNCQIHEARGPERERERLRRWISDMVSGRHPTCRASDFTIVEDTARRAIVSSLCLISQTWSYGGVKFGVGMPEAVGTKPEYRRRGFIRAQFEVIHEWSAKRGHSVQAVHGIPNFYRQFGYEMALEVDGGRVGYESDVPRLKKGEKERYRVRPAREDDLPFVTRVYRNGMKRYLVSCCRDKSLWHYELMGRDPRSMSKTEACVIESPGGAPVGLLVHARRLWRHILGVWVYELKPGASWLDVTPSVLRYLVKAGERRASREKTHFASFALELASQHPVYQVVRDRLPRLREPYAFYIRVADVPAFLRRVAPVLERRIAESVIVGYTGELKISFYRGGLHMAFKKGRLVQAQPWAPGEGQSAAFPDHTFLHLLFGHRSVDELRLSYRDCSARNDEARLVLEVLFPKMPSCVWAWA